MLEPLHQAGQWAWQQAASKANRVSAGWSPSGDSPDSFASSSRWQVPQSGFPTLAEQSDIKGIKPTLPETAIGQTLWRRGRQTIQQLSDNLWQKLGRPKPNLKPSPPSTRLRPRDLILKDFPYNEVSKLPRFTLSPDEIRRNPAAERLHQLEAAQVFQAPWDSTHLFNPFLEH